MASRWTWAEGVARKQLRWRYGFRLVLRPMPIALRAVLGLWPEASLARHGVWCSRRQSAGARSAA